MIAGADPSHGRYPVVGVHIRTTHCPGFSFERQLSTSFFPRCVSPTLIPPSFKRLCNASRLAKEELLSSRHRDLPMAQSSREREEHIDWSYLFAHMVILLRVCQSLFVLWRKFWPINCQGRRHPVMNCNADMHLLCDPLPERGVISLARPHIAGWKRATTRNV
jgi:hypothetical protein